MLRAWERKKLNERPIYLRSVFFMLAILQSACHLYYDYDKITLPPTKPKTEGSSEHLETAVLPSSQLKQSLPSLVNKIALRAAGMSIFGPIIYALFIRSAAWNCSLYFAEILWDVPKSRLSYVPPYHISLIIRSFTTGTLLISLWEVSNQVFSAYVAQEPLKREQPLTSESKDPNGSLLIGLKSKKEVLKVLYLLLILVQILITPVFRILGTCIHQPTLRSASEGHVLRHRPSRWFRMEPNNDTQPGQCSGCHQPYIRIPKPSPYQYTSTTARHH